MISGPGSGDPGDALTFTVEVQEDGSAASGKTVTFSITSGDGNASLGATSATTGSNGRASTSVTLGDSASGSYTITATVGSKTTSGTATVNTPPPPPVLSISVISGPGSGDPGDSLTFTVEVQEDGSAASGKTVAFSITSGDGNASLNPTSATTGSSGRASTSVTLGGSASGSYTITASSGSKTTSGTATVEGAPPPPLRTLVMSHSPWPLDPGESMTFTVTVKDDGSPVQDQTVTFSVSPDDGTVSLSTTSATTGSNGQASTTLRTGSGSSGSYTVTATVGTLSLRGSVTVETSPPPSSQQQQQQETPQEPVTTLPLPEATVLESISGGNQEGVPGEALANPFVVEVRDQNESPLEGVTVTFAVTAGAGTLSATTATTDANGRAESTLTLGSDPGTNSVKVSVEGISRTEVFSAEASLPPPEPTDLSIVSGDNQTGLTGEALANPFVIEVRDQYDDPMAGVTVTFALRTSGGSLSSEMVTTNANGRAESTLTLGSDPGTNTVKVSVEGISRTEMFSAEAGLPLPEPTALSIVSGDNQEAAIGEVLANSFVVEVRDQYDDPMAGVTVTFALLTGGGSLSSEVMTDANGRAESILTLGPNLGRNTVTVSVTEIQEQQTFTAEGIRIPLAFWIISGDKQQGLLGEALANPFVVEVRDQSGDPLPGVQVTFSVSSGGGTLSATITTTDNNGRVKSTLTLGPNPGTNTVKVAATGIHRTQSVSAIAELPPIPQDVNRDDMVNILDLVLVASVLGDEGGDLAADVNGDGVVNILDLVVVAGALGNAAAAPSVWYRDLEIAPTRAEVGQWLAQAGELGLTDATSQRGVLFLEQLLAMLAPKETALLPNYPNPFNPETWIPYQLSGDSPVSVSIYDTTGVLIRTLSLGIQSSGFYNSRGRAAYWDGRNDAGEHVASGLYFYQLTTPTFHQTRRLVIVK